MQLKLIGILYPAGPHIDADWQWSKTMPKTKDGSWKPVAAEKVCYTGTKHEYEYVVPVQTALGKWYGTIAKLTDQGWVKLLLPLVPLEGHYAPLRVVR